MVNIRSANEIILSLIDLLKISQPNADSKPGSVIRDLFIDLPASQLSILYDQLSAVTNKSSMRLVVGSDLDKLAKNFGLVRKTATIASGVALMTFSSINANININKGDLVIANNGISYQVSNGTVVSAASTNFYRSIASKYADQLSFVGITDQYAVEVTVSATTPGSAGRISAYSLTRTSTAGVSNVTNISAFTGGTDQESDASFRSRILSAFSGSSVGTALGYLNAVLTLSGVSDAAVIQPGDPLMTRDGTIVSTAADGTKTIVSEGSGGKVDVVVLGVNLSQNTDSFIYLDKSNNNDPTNTKNDFILGQIAADAGKTINKKRIDDIANGQVPAQPVESVLQVSGTSSGSNFKEKSVDAYGRVSGNYELIKDTGIYAGSPWGQDKIHWINDRINDFSEDLIKGQFNGQDPASFTDVTKISNITQNVLISNENSKLTSDRSVIQLQHTPATNVTRVLNVNTGERYLITDQNPDKTGTYNTTGLIKISGNTLPTASDVLQVDYSWVVNYDPHSDYDGLINTNNARIVNDSIDWGYSSLIKKERINFTKSSNFFIGTTSHPVSNIIKANQFQEITGKVTLITSGIYINRLSVVLSYLSSATSTVDSVKLKNSNVEVFNTAQSDGSFSSLATVSGINVVYTTTIILPKDTSAVDGDYVTAIINSSDVFNISSNLGSSSGNQVTIPSTSINTIANNIVLEVTYIGLITDLLSTTINNLPLSRVGNGIELLDNNGFANFSKINISRKESLVVQQNLSLQYYVDLSILAIDAASPNVLTVVRLSDGKELWNSDNAGTIITGNNGNYQLILSGYNTPVTSDRVVAIYYAVDSRRFQPFSYENDVIQRKVYNLTQDPATGRLSIPLFTFTSQASGLVCSIIDPNTDIVLLSATDAALTASGTTATVHSPTVMFSNIVDIVNKQIKITNPTDPNNSGIYDIISYNSITNILSIQNVLDNITKDQVSVVRLLDGKEVWDYAGMIDLIDQKLLLSKSALANPGDVVYAYVFNYKTLRSAPTKLLMTTSDQVINTGTISVSGTSISKGTDVVFTATNSGLKLNIAEAVKKVLGLSSASSIPPNIALAKIVKLEKVTTVGLNNDEVLSVLATFDVEYSLINNNLLFTNDMIASDSLSSLDFVLPSTNNNLLSDNLPKIGDKLRITFYFSTENDVDNISFSRNGSLYTNKKFALINKMFVSSGFKSSQSTKITNTSFTQPNLGSRYRAFYDYIAPKQNERISITYNNNKLISDATFAIENNRPINADVLVKGAKVILIDTTVNIVISSDYQNSSATVVQNVKDQILAALTTTQLAQVIDTTTLVNVAQGVQGVSRARVASFNKSGAIGQVTSIQCQKDEYYSPNIVNINIETR